MNYPKAWIDYLIYFHTDQDFFECHEVLEEHWKKEGMKGNLWPGLIQIAVALYHQRRGNMNGARRMITSGIEKLATENAALHDLGVEPNKLIDMLEKRKFEIQQQKVFEPFSLPLTTALKKTCLLEAEKTGKVWDANAVPDEAVIHKHRLRDRTPVIEEREKQKLQKNRIL